MRRSFTLLVSGVVGALLLLAACGADEPEQAAPEQRTLTVFAASSLTGAFTELGKRFEADHPGVTVSFSFGGSSELVAQLVQGAPADVFASADATTMEKLVAADLNGIVPSEFATNTLVVVTPADNPAGITSFADLADPDVDLVLCAPEVPCGAATAQVEAAADLDLAPVSEEQSVKDVLGKVVAGEADAGVVYVTDALAAGDAVATIEFPAAAQAPTTYLIANLETNLDDLSTGFIDLVTLTEAGRRVLAAAGFVNVP